jgi:peptidoglycan-associated lipoprotein
LSEILNEYLNDYKRQRRKSMIRSRFLFLILPVMLTAIVLIACNRKMETAAVKSEAPSSAASPAPESPKGEAVPPVQSQATESATANSIQFQDAFFDFNKSLIRADGKNALQEDAKLLKEYPNFKIQIEGHCDERGTEEYNLALGNRRAEAVKRYLGALGVEPVRISTISYGKDKPFCTEKTEACYQQNRRGHFVRLTQGS